MDRSRLALIVVSFGVAAGHLVARLPLLSSRRFDPDELEHTHMAWYISLGEVPFRDFFEHHTPLFHYLLAGFLGLFEVERSPDHALQALFAARHVAWTLSLAIVVATGLLAWRLRDATTAWVVLPLASGGIVIALRAIEIRPDGLSTLLWLASLGLLHAGLTARRPSARRAKACFALAGLSIGLGVLTSQKLLVAGPPLLLLTAWYLISPRFSPSWQVRAVNTAWLVAGVVVPWAAAFTWFTAHGAGAAFLGLTLLDGLRWKQETSAGSILAFIARYEPWIFGLAAGGAVRLFGEIRRRGEPVVGTIVLLLSSAGMFAGLFLLPVPYAQYCLTFMPLFAILAAVFLVEGTRVLANVERLRFSATSLAAVTPVVVLAALGLYLARPVVITEVVYPALVAAALLTVLGLPLYRRPPVALAVVVAVLAVFPAQWTRWMSDLGDDGQFAELRYVLARTAPGDIVLDGWTGYGVFRRHAGFYWMFHPGVRAMLPTEAVDTLVQTLESGRVRPAVVVFDDNLRQLSPRLAAFVEARYEPAGVGDIWLPRGGLPRDSP